MRPSTGTILADTFKKIPYTDYVTSEEYKDRENKTCGTILCMLDNRNIKNGKHKKEDNL